MCSVGKLAKYTQNIKNKSIIFFSATDVFYKLKIGLKVTFDETNVLPFSES